MQGKLLALFIQMGAVFLIAVKRASQARHLHSYLMGAACLQAYLY